MSQNSNQNSNRLNPLPNVGTRDNKGSRIQIRDRATHQIRSPSGETPTNQYKRCTICSSTYKVGMHKRKWWKIRKFTSPREIYFIRYDDDVEYDCRCGSKMESIMAFVVMVSLFVVLFLTVCWVLYYRDGLWHLYSIKNQLNWHPVLMVAGFITISGFSILLHKLCVCLKPTFVNFLHALLKLSVLPCAIVGLTFALDAHNLSIPPIVHFKSLHSWLGLTTIGLYAIEVIVGFFRYFSCKSTEGGCSHVPSSVEDLHKLIATIDFTLAIMTCLTGLSNRLLRYEANNELNGEEIFKNCLGITILLTGFFVVLFLKFT